MIRLDNNFRLIVEVYESIKRQIAEEFKLTYHPSQINIPVDIDVSSSITTVYFNLGIYQSKTCNNLCQLICEHTSYINEVDLHETDRYAELALVIIG